MNAAQSPPLLLYLLLFLFFQICGSELKSHGFPNYLKNNQELITTNQLINTYLFAWNALCVCESTEKNP